MSRTYNMYIGGQWVESLSGETLTSFNPATEVPCAQIPQGNAADVDRAVQAASDCFHSHAWQALTYKDRADLLREIGDLIMEHAVPLSQLETEENGKPIKETSLIDIPSSAEAFKTFAAMTLDMRGETFPSDGETFSYTIYEPIGVVAQIIPWNYPLLMAAWKLAPALAAGNTVVIKPSEFTSATLLELGKLLGQTALPAGAVNIVTGTGAAVGKPLIEHPKVGKVAFTGSTKTGQAVLCSSALHTIPATLELGGKSATLVFEDSPLEKTVHGALSAIFMNQGQMCVAGSRLLIHETIYAEFLAQLTAKLKKLSIGPGALPTTDMGPLISREHRDRVAGFVQRALDAGARCEIGNGDMKLPETGYFFAPTVLSQVSPEMEIWQAEVFGPVVIVAPFHDDDEALHLANQSDYGLAASIWTQDAFRIQRFTRALNVGMVWVNTYGSFSNEVPFGGVKRSGFGKELGRDGLLANCRKKSITMDISPDKTPLVARWYGV